MTIASDYLRQLIIKIACDTTGNSPEEIIKQGRLQITTRDAIEFMVRLEVHLNCQLAELQYDELSIDITELVTKISHARNAQSSTEPPACSPER